MRWLPGLRFLLRYERGWLRHDILAGLVLTTMLVPVGVAYAEASGVPGIYGLYATILPLLAYALFGPSRILILGPDSARGRDTGSCIAALGWRSESRSGSGGNDGVGFWRGLHRRRSGTPRLHNRVAVQTNSLRIHERHRADRAVEPDAENARLLHRSRRAAASTLGHSQAVLAGEHQRRDARHRGEARFW